MDVVLPGCPAHRRSTMPHNPHASFDQAVLDMIEHSPVGAVPNTPTYQDALKRLYGAHQVYAHADHKGGHVTARSLAGLPIFSALNLDALVAGTIEPHALESNGSIFSRYVQSLPAALQTKAEAFRNTIAARAPQHRDKLHATHDPLHTLVLVPGTGPHHGLPGNYLHGSVLELNAGSTTGAWSVQLHDCDDGAAIFDAPTLAAAVTALHEALECAPFHLEELEALGFRLN
jgi:hypothetical protein